jgi:tetratricopeptide (TPR) repeat protein
MGRIIYIVGDTVLSIMGFAFICWVFWRSLKRSEDPVRLLFKYVFTVVFVTSEFFFARWLIKNIQPGEPADNLVPTMLLVGSITLCSIIVGGVWTAQISGLLISPITNAFDGGNIPVDPKPFYSMAIAKRKRNRPLEAIIDIREQLARFPNDFEGVMLLANIQAEDLKDLPSAEMTLNHFCDWEDAPPKQFAAAMAQLADWHLKFCQDGHSARAALQRIVEKYPETELSLLAKQRIAHVAGAEKHFLAAQERQPISMPEGVKNVGLLESSAHLVPDEIPPEELAATYVKQLSEHPDDTEAREKLAVLYAIHYKRLDLAKIELNQLINEPNHPPKRIAHWLNLLADLQIKCGGDYEMVHATLEQIIERFPDFAVADVARSRLARLRLEFKGLEKTPSKTLGEYEQNIGLKGKRRY